MSQAASVDFSRSSGRRWYIFTLKFRVCFNFFIVILFLKNLVNIVYPILDLVMLGDCDEQVNHLCGQVGWTQAPKLTPATLKAIFVINTSVADPDPSGYEAFYLSGSGSVIT